LQKREPATCNGSENILFSELHEENSR
jgi:hypothetical protein